MVENAYNQEKLYEKEIQPLVDEIKKICAEHRLPFFTCVAVSNTAKKTTYKYDGLLTGYLDIALTDDKFSKHLCVANGFDVKPVGVSSDFSDVTDFISELPDGMFESYAEEIIEE